MGALLDFFAAGPARVKGLLVGALAVAVLALGLTAWALVERAGRFQALAERDAARAQEAVLSGALARSNAAVDEAKRVADAAVAGTAQLVAAAKRLHAPEVHTVERIERIIQAPEPAGADCNSAWQAIEGDARASGR